MKAISHSFYTIAVSNLAGVRLELHSQPPGYSEQLPRHWHEEYQVGLPLTADRRYQCRSADHFVPVGGIAVLPPGEMHTASGGDTNKPIVFQTAYIQPTLWERIAEEMRESGRRVFPLTAPVVFSEPQERFLRHQLLTLQQLREETSPLERDVLLMEVIVGMIQRASPSSMPVPTRAVSAAVQRVRDYLHEYFDQGLSLNQLALVAGVSPSYLSHIFRQEVGLPPHHYQTQLRITRARILLASGRRIGEVACEVGFADQSHLTRQFKRFLGVTPNRYAPKPFVV